jgi:drug/metabolite transporter (DMT)-like permease
MFWIIVTILAYFFLAISAFGDKYLLTGGIPEPKTYSFYVGILSIFVLIFVPFGFFFPNFNQILLAFFTGAIFIIGLFLYYSVIKEFEASRVVPAVGGLVPIFVFLIAYFFSQNESPLSLRETFSFLLLIFGSVLITIEKSTRIFGKSFFLSSVAAFYFALYFVLAKFIYVSLGFINGFIWIRMGSFLIAPIFLFSREVRSQIFHKIQLPNLRTFTLFIGNQIIGSIGSILQNWAVALTKLNRVALVNAMQGIMYVFLFIFSFISSKKFPQILKEEISKEVIFQKIIAILLIGGGLSLLTF